MSISCTKSYELFKIVNWNREVDPLLVEKWKRELTKEYRLDVFPMLCSPTFEIYDGQHRFLACKDLDLPVYFRIEAKLKPEDMARANTGKHWTTEDFIHCGAERGIPDYIKIRDIRIKNDQFPFGALIILVGKQKDAYKKIRDGLLVVSQSVEEIQNSINRVEGAISLLKSKLDDSKYFFRSTALIGALCFIYRNPEINWERFMYRLDLNVSKFYKCHSQSEAVLMLKNIYNYKAKNKVGA